MMKKNHDTFVLLALGYLALPNLLFVALWIKPLIGIPVAAALLWAIVSASKINRENESSETRFSYRQLSLIVGLAVLWTILSGTGNVVPQSGDYIKHNALFHDLISKPWPLLYDQNSGASGSFLCYGVAYYLVPSGLAGWLGENWVNALSFLWAAVGLVLVCYWLALLNPKSPFRTVIVFLLFSTFGIAWYVAKRGHFEYFTQIGLEHSFLDHWAKLYFTPQHGISAWLGAALVYRLGWEQRRPASAFLAWTTLILWSPFVSVGLFPILLVTIFAAPPKTWFAWVPLTGGLLLMGVMAVYFEAHQHLEHQGAIWNFAMGHPWLPYYLLFIVLEVLIPAGCVLYFDYRHRVLDGWRPLFLCATAVLLVFPLFKMGHESDLRLQGSGGLTAFLALGFAACLCSPKFRIRSMEGMAVLLIFAVSAVYPLGRPILNLKEPRVDYSFEATSKSTGMRDMSEIGKAEGGPGFDISQQYLGRGDSIAYRSLLRR